MPRQTKARDIGHRVGLWRQNLRGQRLGLLHLLKRCSDPSSVSLGGHFSGHDHARADGFRQYKGIAGPRASQCDRILFAQAGDGEPHCQLIPQRCMTSDDFRASFADHAAGCAHDLGQGALLQRRCKARQDQVRRRGLRSCTHGPDVPKRMDRGNACHHIGIEGKGAQMIGTDHLACLPHGQQCRIVPRERRDILP